jgi:hypothetical protein
MSASHVLPEATPHPYPEVLESNVQFRYGARHEVKTTPPRTTTWLEFQGLVQGGAPDGSDDAFNFLYAPKEDPLAKAVDILALRVARERLPEVREALKTGAARYEWLAFPSREELGGAEFPFERSATFLFPLAAPLAVERWARGTERALASLGLTGVDADALNPEWAHPLVCPGERRQAFDAFLETYSNQGTRLDLGA